MSTVEQIVDLIRAEHRSRVGGFAISTGEAIELIEQYGMTMAAEEAVRCTGEAWDKAIAALAIPSTPRDGAAS